jgi:hypothetical protein
MTEANRFDSRPSRPFEPVRILEVRDHDGDGCVQMAGSHGVDQRLQVASTP